MPGRQAKVLFTFVLILYLPIAALGLPLLDEEKGGGDGQGNDSDSAGVALEPWQVVTLAVAALTGVLGMWITLWVAAAKNPELVKDLLLNQHFLRGMAVIMVLAAVTVLALSSKLQGQAAGAILSGVVGYVLGSRVSPDKTSSANRGSRELGGEG